ncbi:unnamed protein product [Linum tenue]|uniref:C2H2-type domain-containing protein n=1 Tax=Linum tenue TaxID=586396 RepID=A0AAV0HJQ0_9ROSI|nr:unnamed protein product [Linum tenue]
MTMLAEKMATTEEATSAAILSTNSFSHDHNPFAAGSNPPPPPLNKKKRNLPGTPGKQNTYQDHVWYIQNPEAEVIALSPKTLMATNRFLCEICGKGFQRDQNLQLHRRGHNLPWKLKQRTSKEIRKRVYVCPEKSCVHHHPSRALGDLTGIKKHFCRKHGEKKWKCDKCAKRYAVQSDWKAHSKTCGTREYKCDCGTLFSRRDSFITHRAFCDALAEETARMNAASTISSLSNLSYNNLMGAAPLAHHMAPHFSSLFKPISIKDHQHHHQHHQAEILLNQEPRGMMALWTSQAALHEPSIGSNSSSIIHQEIRRMGSITSGPMFGDHIPLPPQSEHHHHYDLSWPIVGLNNGSNNNNNSKSNSSGCITSTTNVSVPSLYSTQKQQQGGGVSLSSSSSPLSSSANMSATALLQKAAQMGATSTTADPSFLGSLGITKPNSSSSNNNNNNNSHVNSSQAMVQADHYHGNRFCGLYGTTDSSHHQSSMVSPFGSLLENFNSSAARVGAANNDILNLSHVQLQHQQHQQELQAAMYPAWKRQKTFQGSEDCGGGGGGGGGQTRDFLGVGAAVHQALCHPSSINGWI